MYYLAYSGDKVVVVSGGGRIVTCGPKMLCDRARSRHGSGQVLPCWRQKKKLVGAKDGSVEVV